MLITSVINGEKITFDVNSPLRIVYKDYTSSFNDLLKKVGSVLTNILRSLGSMIWDIIPDNIEVQCWTLLCILYTTSAGFHTTSRIGGKL